MLFCLGIFFQTTSPLCDITELAYRILCSEWSKKKNKGWSSPTDKSRLLIEITGKVNFAPLNLGTFKSVIFDLSGDTEKKQQHVPASLCLHLFFCAASRMWTWSICPASQTVSQALIWLRSASGRVSWPSVRPSRRRSRQSVRGGADRASPWSESYSSTCATVVLKAKSK